MDKSPRANTAWGLVAASFASLLASSYLDNIRGPLLPRVAEDLGLSFGDSGAFLAVGSLAATVATFSLLHLLHRYTERTVMIGLALLGVLTGLATFLVQGNSTLLLYGMLVGSTFATFGTMSNVLIVEGAPEHSQSRFIAALHSMYGVGSALATAVVAWGLGVGLGWRIFFAAAVPIYLGMAVVAWRCIENQRLSTPPEKGTYRLNIPQALVVVTFTVYVAGEVTAAMWLTSYLVGTWGFSVADATPYATIYFLVMTFSRVAAALWASPKRETMIIVASLAIPILALSVARFGWTWALPLVGLFGPFFPIFLARANRAFASQWRHVTIWIMVSMSFFIALCHLFLGTIADRIGISNAYGLPMALLAVALALAVLTLRKLRPEAV